MGTIKSLKNDEFKTEVLESKLPTLVDFYADWCGPCRMLAPVLEQAKKELEGKVNIVKVNVDDLEDVARKYRVMSIPTMVLVVDGVEQDRIVGLQTLQSLIERINENI